MLGDIIYLKVDGVHQDWKTYRFDLDIKTPGKKVSDTLYTLPDLNSICQTFAFQIKESPFQSTTEENLLQTSSERDSDNASKQSDDDLASSEIKQQYFLSMYPILIF